MNLASVPYIIETLQRVLRRAVIKSVSPSKGFKEGSDKTHSISRRRININTIGGEEIKYLFICSLFYFIMNSKRLQRFE